MISHASFRDQHARKVITLIGFTGCWILCWAACLTGCRGPDTFKPTDRSLSWADHDDLALWQTGWTSFGPDLVSGGIPPGDEAFDLLAAQGFKLVVSVDGARPNLRAAQEAGLSYVHLPMGYHGVDESVALGLLRLMRTAHAPVFIHCHHGRHRAPAAAAIAALSVGQLDRQQVLACMQRAGTSRAYAGLWRSVESYQVPEENVPLPELVSVAPGHPLPDAMVAMDHALERLEALCLEREGKSLEELSPQFQEWLVLLDEGFQETFRYPRKNLPPPLPAWDQMLTASHTQSKRVADLVNLSDWEAVEAGLRHLRSTCRACHHHYRDR
jgi:protein tyrosine phosphatase (PTP) superfamily phosphohydrolase (DUF442 family)